MLSPHLLEVNRHDLGRRYVARGVGCVDFEGVGDRGAGARVGGEVRAVQVELRASKRTC